MSADAELLMQTALNLVRTTRSTTPPPRNSPMAIARCWPHPKGVRRQTASPPSDTIRSRAPHRAIFQPRNVRGGAAVRRPGQRRPSLCPRRLFAKIPFVKRPRRILRYQGARREWSGLHDRGATQGALIPAGLETTTSEASMDRKEKKEPDLRKEFWQAVWTTKPSSSSCWGDSPSQRSFR